MFDSFGVAEDVVPGWLTSSSTSWSAVEGTLWVRYNSFNHDLIFNYTFSPEKGALRDSVGVCTGGLSLFFCLHVQEICGAPVTECEWRRAAMRKWV